MRESLRTAAAVLAFPVLINAVALSDMAPRAQNLPPACNNLYTAQIAGCTQQDWQTGKCSSTCSSAMQALVAPIQAKCGGQGVSGQNLIVAYLAGVGPQQLCKNLGTGTTAAATTTSPSPTTQTTSPSPTTVTSGTSTAKSETNSKSLITDASSSSTSSTSTKAKTTQNTATPESSSAAAVTTTQSTTASTSASRTSSADGNSQTDFNDHSGGGSPFDTEGNLMNAASGLSVSVLSWVGPALAGVAMAALR